MNKRRRLRRGLAAAVLSALALSGCEEQVRARDVFGGEPLAAEHVAGLRVVDERWLDGGDGGLVGKPSYATVSLTFSTEDGVSQEMAVATLVSRAEEPAGRGTATIPRRTRTWHARTSSGATVACSSRPPAAGRTRSC